MSADHIREIIRRSVIDRAFAKALAQNFQGAVKAYNLSAFEVMALKAMQIEFDGRYKKVLKSKHRQHVPRSKT